MPDPSFQDRLQHTVQVRETFDEWVRTGMADGMERRHKRLAELMLDRISMPADACILDIGCGDGWMARLVSSRLSQGACVGIDVSTEMIHRARLASEDTDNILFTAGEVEEIPWAEDYFSHVLSIESAYYWTDLGKATREVYRVTSHGGSFHILINYYSENPFSEGWGRDMDLRLHRLSAREWANTFREAGFERVSTDRIPDDSPISSGKPPDELARRKGLQRVGALYLTGTKPSLPEPAGNPDRQSSNPFRLLR